VHLLVIFPMRTETDHTFGNRAATVELLEYGDFECPDCGEAYPIIKLLKEEMREKLVVVFRHMPLDQLYPIHPNATLAAEATEAAANQGKFWEMHDALFEHQADLSDEVLEQLAEEIDLDLEKFHQDLADEAITGKVSADLKSGQELGVTATPTFFINGEKVEDSRNYQHIVERVKTLAANES